MQEIDFLPEGYCQTHVRRRVFIWRAAAAAAAVVLIACAAVLGSRENRALAARLDGLRAQADRVAASLGNEAELARQLSVLEVRAELYTHLRSRVAFSRILGTIANGCPPGVVLHNVSIVRERRPAASSPASATAGRPQRGRPGAQAGPDSRPEAADLEQLRAARREAQLVVVMDAASSSELAIAEYLDALDACGLFSEVMLAYSDRREEGAGGHAFRARLVLREE